MMSSSVTIRKPIFLGLGSSSFAIFTCKLGPISTASSKVTCSAVETISPCKFLSFQCSSFFDSLDLVLESIGVRNGCLSVMNRMEHMKHVIQLNQTHMISKLVPEHQFEMKNQLDFITVVRIFESGPIFGKSFHVDFGDVSLNILINLLVLNDHLDLPLHPHFFHHIQNDVNINDVPTFIFEAQVVNDFLDLVELPELML